MLRLEEEVFPNPEESKGTPAGTAMAKKAGGQTVGCTRITTEWADGVGPAIDTMPRYQWTDGNGITRTGYYTAAPVPQAGELRRQQERRGQ